MNKDQIGIVSHDAGGAEIISSYVVRNSLQCMYCLSGAAQRVFQRKLGAVKNNSLEYLVDQSDWLLLGTSFLSDLEWRGIALAREAGKRSIVVLDHWVNYRQRFIRHGEWHWPDEVWLGDEIGMKIAKEILPEIKQTFVPNAYFMDLQDEFRSLSLMPQQSSLNVLYVCEPLREDGIALYGNERHWGYTEEEALSFFLSHIDCLGDSIGRIVVRPHPQEAIDKYDWAVTEFDLPIVCGESKTLLEQIAECDVVVGCATMAMVVGLLAGKRVVSCVPPGGKTVQLPHTEIECMSHLIMARGAAE